MFLKVKGVGKILDSTIEMKGITVIAGENNTGKSTFGKALYCIFNAFCNSDKMVLDERTRGIRESISRNLMFSEFKSIQLSNKLIEQIINLKTSFSADKFREILLNSSDKIDKSDIKIVDNIIERSIDELEQYINFNDIEIKKILINRYFRSEFFRQINHINSPDTPGEVSLDIGGKQVQVILAGNECINFVDKIGIIHTAIYIDTPFILDDAGKTRAYVYSGKIKHRSDLLYRIIKEGEAAVIIEAIAKQKLNHVLNIINSMADGDFKKSGDSLTFLDHSIRQPIALQNISAGMKIFLIIKRLLEQNEIKERDILIFDEPEIHLHPEWQIKFAEILVLLQKEFNLTILLTTHSPYFLHAIEVFCCKHDIKEQTNYYLAKSESDTSGVQDVTKNIDVVYQQLALPFQKLEDMRYED